MKGRVIHTKRGKETERDTQRFSICCFTAQMAAVNKTRLMHKPRAKVFCQISHMGAGVFGPSSTAFPGVLARSLTEVGQQRFELETIWNTGVAVELLYHNDDPKILSLKIAALLLT